MPTTPTLATHELLLSDGTTTLGLFLARDAQRVPILQHLPAKALVDQSAEGGRQTEAIFPVDIKKPFTIVSNHGGFGAQEYKPNRYLQSIGTDASVEGMIHTGPVAVGTGALIATYAKTLIAGNLSFETADFTGWAEGGGTWTIQSGGAQSGTYYARTPALNGFTATLRQQISTGIASVWRGLQITVDIYSRYNTASPSGACTLTLQDSSGGVTIAQVNIHKTSTGWTLTTLTHTFTDGWPQLWLEIAATGDNTNQYLDIDAMVITVTGNITLDDEPIPGIKMANFNNVLYYASTTGLWKRVAEPPAAMWDRVLGSPDNITDMATDGTDLYLARGTSYNYWKMTSAEVFTRNTGTGASSKPKFIAWVGENMYGHNGTQTGWKYNNLATGAVANTYTIGQSGFNATSLLEHKAIPFVFWEHGGAYINIKITPNSVVSIMDELGGLFNANTGKNAISFAGDGDQFLYVPAGSGAALWYYDDTEKAPIGPDVFAKQLTDFKGQIIATAKDDQWLYIVMANGTKIELLKGRWEWIDGITEFRWHPFFEATTASATGAFVSSIGIKRLFYWGGAYTVLPSYIPLPTQYGDPLNDANLTHKTGTTHETSWLDEGLPHVLKTYLAFSLSSINLTGSTRTIKVEYMLWENQSWVELGGTGNGIFNTSPYQSKPFAASVSSRAIRFRYTLNTNSSATGVAIRRAGYTYALDPSRLDLFLGRIIVANDNHYRNSGELDTEMTYPVVAPQLHAWKATQPLTLTYPDGKMDGPSGEHDGATMEVKFLDEFPQEQFITLGEPITASGIKSEFRIALVSIVRE